MTRDESDVKSDTFVYRTGYRLVSLRYPFKEIWFVGGASLDPSLVSSTCCVDWLIFARHNAERHSNFHRPPTKLQEGNVFTGVCLSTGGVYARSQVLSGVLCLVPGPFWGWVLLVPGPFWGWVSLIPGPFWGIPGRGRHTIGGGCFEDPPPFYPLRELTSSDGQSGTYPTGMHSCNAIMQRQFALGLIAVNYYA